MSEEGTYSAGIGQTISRTIAEKTIAYRPSLRSVSASVTGAILLQQIAYHWYRNGEKPFYKFIEPCGHPDYRKGDSWAEELEFSYSEIQTALSKFAAKVESGKNKKELAEQYSVIFWTDADRVTWWQFNPATFELSYKSHLPTKSEESTYPISKDSQITLIESIKDNTKELITGKKKSKLPANSDLSWQLASGASAEEIAASNAKDAEELALLMHYESKMGYGTTLDWWGKNADLVALRKFLVTQTRADIETFAKWCKRLYSKFKPEDAVRFPRNVMTFWPMAFEKVETNSAPEIPKFVPPTEGEFIPNPYPRRK